MIVAVSTGLDVETFAPQQGRPIGSLRFRWSLDAAGRNGA